MEDLPMSVLRVNERSEVPKGDNNEESPKLHLQAYNSGIFRSFVAQNDMVMCVLYD
jgi:hypothetical protein